MPPTENQNTESANSSPVAAGSDPTGDRSALPAVIDLETHDSEERSLVAEDLGEHLDTFEAAELHPRLLEAIGKLGWTKPTPVQSLCLPYTLKGRDVAGFAQTGTGKTGVFLITTGQRMLQPNAAATPEAAPAPSRSDAAYPVAVVLVPTRELAVQIEDDASTLFKLLGIRSIAVYGGIDYEKQAKHLREGVDVIVATPGRLKDFFQKKIISLEKCSIFVCDEADRMFDMGFIEDVEFFLEKLPEQTQKLLFSATTNAEVKELAFEYLDKPAYISVNPEIITPETIEQHAILCDATTKLKVLLGLLRDHNPDCSIIFTNTKLTAEWLHFKLVHNGIDADLITGDLPQKKRISLIQKIKEGKIKALIATDVASRGLHISRVTHVYNFDLPDEPANYVHRIGRTARAGAKGSSFSLVCDDYGHNLAEIKTLLGSNISLDSKWFDERYLAIEDKAGNPFKDLKARAPRPANGDDFRSGDSGPRGGGRSDSSRGGRPSGPRSDRPQEGRGGPGRGPGRGQGPNDRPSGAQDQSGRGRPGQGQGRGGRDQQRERGGQDRQGYRDHRGPKPQHGGHQARPAAAQAKSAAPVEAAPKTVTGMIKKIFATLFGGKKS